MTLMLLTIMTRQIFSTHISLLSSPATPVSSLTYLIAFIIRSSCIENITISEYEVFEPLSALDPNKATGIDNINPKILKYCAPALFLPIHHLFSLTLVYQLLPQDWKTHIITPVHKSGNKSAVNNYQPISLLCVISKVLERILFNKISNFIVEAISPNQFGFLRGRSYP